MSIDGCPRGVSRVHRRAPHARDGATARLIDPGTVELLDVLGPTIQLLVDPEDSDTAHCLMRGAIPPGGFVPLHSHPDPETFLVLSGNAEGLADSAEGLRWMRLSPGDLFHVPGGARHAFRNRSPETAIMLIASTATMGRFFREVGAPIAPGNPPASPSPERVRRFLQIADRYGYWNATADENLQVGIPLSPA